MKAFVTGGTGFIGERVIRRLRDRDDDVVALVRTPSKATALADLGCELVEGDLGSEDAIRRGVGNCDAAFHIAAIYKVGIPRKERPAMYDANVRGTERVLDAAIAAGAERIVYVSTVNAFGNTKGRIVDETYRRPPNEFLSTYDETKYLSHEVAKDRIAAGAPIVVVQPSMVYGPGDHSEVGKIIEATRTGKQHYLSFPKLGLSSVHVDDVAEGILLAHDKGRIGESYVLAGEITTLRELVDKVARLAGTKPPRVTMPAAAVWASIPLGPLVGPLMGLPPNIGELYRASKGVTYWAKDDKARAELGYAPRDLDTGLTQMFSVTA